MSNSEPLTSGEVGAMFGVSSRTIIRRAEAGELPYIRKLPGPNGDYLFDSRVMERELRKLKAVS